MKRLINTPLKSFGFLTILLGLIATILTLGYLLILGLIFIGVGLLLYLIDFTIDHFFKEKKGFLVFQILLAIAYLVFACFTYLKWQEHNSIVFPLNFKGQAGIVFGIEGYPKLPETKFWTKTIEMPQSGVIITSTKIEEIPSSLKFYYNDNSIVNINAVDWESNFEYDCIICESKVKSWLFTVDNVETISVKNRITKLCNDIANKKTRSLYKSDFSPIAIDNRGKYLWLQNKGITSLPEGLSKFPIYKAILTGNRLTEVPRQILEITSLEDLIMAGNPITEFPENLSKLTRLKSFSIASTGIKEIKINLSQLDSLEYFDCARNNLTKLPDEIKNIPNLKWLSLNENKFKDLSFVDKRLWKLETLYLYSNQISNLSTETKYLVNLKNLLIFDNKIQAIPDNVKYLIKLEKLEIWDNPIKYISPSISKLTKLKYMRIDDDNLTDTDKENLKKWLPKCKIEYQTQNQKKKNAL